MEDCALVVILNVALEVLRDDPDDNRVLERAVTARADYIVSGDRHLLKLSAYEGIPIITVRQFMDAVKAGS